MSGILFCRWAMIITILPLFAGCKMAGKKSSPKISPELGTELNDDQYRGALTVIVITENGRGTGTGTVVEKLANLGPVDPKFITAAHVVRDRLGNPRECYIALIDRNFTKEELENLDLNDTDLFYKIPSYEIPNDGPEYVLRPNGEWRAYVPSIKNDIAIIHLPPKIFKGFGGKFSLGRRFVQTGLPGYSMVGGAEHSDKNQARLFKKVKLPEASRDTTDDYLAIEENFIEKGDSGAPYFREINGEYEIFGVLSASSEAIMYIAEITSEVIKKMSWTTEASCD